jgi:hypothetical protein
VVSASLNAQTKNVKSKATARLEKSLGQLKKNNFLKTRQEKISCINMVKFMIYLITEDMIEGAEWS